MSLSEYEVGAVMATADIEKAQEFYGNKLGLEVRSDNTPDGPDQLRGRRRAPASASTSRPDARRQVDRDDGGWVVDDLEKVVDELTSNGVTFEQYTDEDGPGARTRRASSPSTAARSPSSATPTGTPTP